MFSRRSNGEWEYSLLKIFFEPHVVLLFVILNGMHTLYSGLQGLSALYIVPLILSYTRFKPGGLKPSVRLHSPVNAFVIVLKIVI